MKSDTRSDMRSNMRSDTRYDPRSDMRSCIYVLIDFQAFLISRQLSQFLYPFFPPATDSTFSSQQLFDNGLPSQPHHFFYSISIAKNISDEKKHKKGKKALTQHLIKLILVTTPISDFSLSQITDFMSIQFNPYTGRTFLDK